MLPIVTVMSPAQVSVFYDPTAMSASELDAAFGPIQAAESRIQQYSFYKCDTSLPVNARLAQEVRTDSDVLVILPSSVNQSMRGVLQGRITPGKRDGWHLCVRSDSRGWYWCVVTTEGGRLAEPCARFTFSRFASCAEEYTLPLEVSPLVRYLHLRGIAGDPADVEAFHGNGV